MDAARREQRRQRGVDRDGADAARRARTVCGGRGRARVRVRGARRLRGAGATRARDPRARVRLAPRRVAVGAAVPVPAVRRGDRRGRCRVQGVRLRATPGDAGHRPPGRHGAGGLFAWDAGLARRSIIGRLITSIDRVCNF